MVRSGVPPIAPDETLRLMRLIAAAGRLGPGESASFERRDRVLTREVHLRDQFDSADAPRSSPAGAASSARGSAACSPSTARTWPCSTSTTGGRGRDGRAIAAALAVGELVSVACDVSDPPRPSKDAVARVVEGVRRHRHPAQQRRDEDRQTSRGSSHPFEDYTLETWREIMGVNIDGMFLMAQAVGRQMIAQGRGGSIIQTASIYGVVAPDQRIYEGSQYLGRRDQHAGGLLGLEGGGRSG